MTRSVRDMFCPHTRPTNSSQKELYLGRVDLLVSLKENCTDFKFQWGFRKDVVFPNSFDGIHYMIDYPTIPAILKTLGEKITKKKSLPEHEQNDLSAELDSYFVASFVHRQDIVIYKSVMPWLSFRHIL